MAAGLSDGNDDEKCLCTILPTAVCQQQHFSRQRDLATAFHALVTSHTDYCNVLHMGWLNCCTAAKTVLTTWGSIPGSRLKIDSAWYPSEVGKMSTQLAGGGGNV